MWEPGTAIWTPKSNHIKSQEGGFGHVKMSAPKRLRISQSRLQYLLHYDRKTGRFTWLVDRGRRARAGDEAGHSTPAGHVMIGIDGRSYSAARLAWLYVTGDLPPCRLVYVDGNPENLAFDNLVPVIDTYKRDYRSVYNRNYYRARRNTRLHGNPLAEPHKMEAAPLDTAHNARSALFGAWDGRLSTMNLSPDEQYAKLQQDRAARRRVRQRRPIEGDTP